MYADERVTTTNATLTTSAGDHGHVAAVLPAGKQLVATPRSGSKSGRTMCHLSIYWHRGSIPRGRTLRLVLQSSCTRPGRWASFCCCLMHIYNIDIQEVPACQPPLSQPQIYKNGRLAEPNGPPSFEAMVWKMSLTCCEIVLYKNP